MSFHAFVDDARHVKEENPFESMMSRFDHAARLLDLDADLYRVLRVPNREITIYIPVQMDDGHLEVFTGYRVQHNFARGPAKGGIRYAPDVTLDEVRALAMVESFNDVCKYAGSRGVNMRIASYMLAVDRVAYITRARGIYA